MEHKVRSIAREKRLLPLVAAGALVLAACGSSKKSATTATTAASGSPITIMTIGPTDAPGFSIPSIPVGAGIAVDEVNAAGGVGGHQVNLVTCNDKNDPNVAAACVRQAIDQKAAAIVGGLSLFDTAIVPLLKSAGIPWIGLTSSAVFSADNVYLFADGATAFTGIGASLVTQGCKNIALVLSASAAPTNAKQIQSGVLAEGGKVATTLNAPATSADWAPTVAKARDAGADCIASGAGPPETGPLIAAINAGAPLRLGARQPARRVGCGSVVVCPHRPRSPPTGPANGRNGSGYRSARARRRSLEDARRAQYRETQAGRARSRHGQ